MLGKIDGRRRRGEQRMRWLDVITNSMDMSLSKLQFAQNNEEQGSVSAAVHGVAVGHNLANEQQNVYVEVLFAFLQSWAIKRSVDHHLRNALVS